MSIMNSFVNDISNVSLRKLPDWHITTNRATITSREFRQAVRLLLPGELAKHAGQRRYQKPSPSTPVQNNIDVCIRFDGYTVRKIRTKKKRFFSEPLCYDKMQNDN
ncbi:unnamed protein product [Acanthoscelides obtectus]|uniref:Uncharacterized protein n=1 Tax=Acanthoscelides obtectus TaxID=200917 RepID=A0A9P0QHL7_ACAOB|nr:unnamed protein product [Acanthoscelides obtectus]CAK1683685.1 Histone H2B [Acanthoscelides obtectus]